MAAVRAPSGRVNVPRGPASFLYSLAGIACVLGLWWYGGANTRFVAPIGEVLGGLPDFFREPDVRGAIGQTWVRVLEALALGLLIGTATAYVMWRCEFWGRVASAFVTALLAVPSTITALLGVFVFTNVTLGAVVVLIVTVFPFVALIVFSALERIEAPLLEMADTYHLSRRERLRHVVWPQVLPSFMAAVRNEHAHAWKVMVVVEVFLVSSGMGFQFDRAFSRFDMVEVMQWLVVFAGILLASEYGVIRPLESRARRWKGERSK